MKTIEWWRNTANHMWRVYFDLVRQSENGTIRIPDDISASAQNIYNTCDRAFRNEFVQSDQEILRMYFTSRWGDDIYAVEDYSLRNGIQTTYIWKVIRRANRIVIEDIGLLDKGGTIK